MTDSEESCGSPVIRATSPSPSSSPTLAIGACPTLERSVSGTSSASTFSTPSTWISRSSDVSTKPPKRRGYVRPLGMDFADSARNRESVMSLGSIAHLQYYFARTGLLDGKGAQMFMGKSKGKPRPLDAGRHDADGTGTLSLSPLSLNNSDSTYSSMRSSPDPNFLGDGDLESPTELEEDQGCWSLDSKQGPAMLPPTVSTYNYRQKHVPPPPTIDELREQLRTTLEDASKILLGSQSEEDADLSSPRRVVTEPTPEISMARVDSTRSDYRSMSPPTPRQSWHEVQGLNILDVMTLAIRAAKLYYTAHEHPAKLYAIRPERRIREDLLNVMDTLKKMALRNFAGGIKVEETQAMQGWVDSVRRLLTEEENREKLESQERESWTWARGDWTGREREREWLFLRSFDQDPTSPLPSWSDPEDIMGSSEFLKAMQNGTRLIGLHNNMVRKSRRIFELIPVYHTDTLKPYRCADNLRFWIKAAERRWEILLRVDVMGVVSSHDSEVWKRFDSEIMRWCSNVRQELMAELDGEKQRRSSR